MASADDTTVAAPPGQNENYECRIPGERIKRLRHTHVATHQFHVLFISSCVSMRRQNTMKHTHSSWLQADSSRIESDAFPDKSERLSGRVWSTFVVTAVQKLLV